MGFLKRNYAYLIVLSLAMTSFGPIAFCLSCSGIFYTPVAAEIGSSPATLSYFITMVTVPMIFMLAPMGKLYARIDCRIIQTAAVAIIALCLLGLSFVHAAWQYLTMAFIMGFGLAPLVFLAPPILINRWFSKNAGSFIGIVMAFTGVGGAVWTPLGGILIAQIGWRMTYLVFAGLTVVLGVPLSIFVLRDRPSDLGLVPNGFHEGETAAAEYEKSGIDAKAAQKMPSFFLLCAFALSFPLGVYVYSMIPSYVATLPVSQSMPLLGALASSCAMVASIVAKILWGSTGERNILWTVVVVCCLGILGIAILAFAPSGWLLICVAAVAYGAYYGEQTVLCPIATRHFFGMKGYGEIYSKITAIICIGVVLGTFGGGTIINATGSYALMFAFVSATTAISAVMLFIAQRAHKTSLAKMESNG